MKNEQKEETQSSLAVRSNEESPRAVQVKTSNGGSTVRFRSPSGMFSKKPKAPTAQEMQRATAAKLTAVTPEKPKSDFEEIIEAQTALAKRSDAENIGTAGVKAAEFLTKAAGFSLAKPDGSGNAPITVIIGVIEGVKDGGTFETNERARPTKPSFAEPPFADVEVISTNS